MDFALVFFLPIVIIVGIVDVIINKNGLSKISDRSTNEEYDAIVKSTLSKLKTVVAISLIYCITVGAVLLLM